MYSSHAFLKPTTMQLRAIELVDLGLSYREVASLLRMSGPVVPKMRIYRMRRRLRIVAPSRRRQHVSQLSACGNNAA